MSSACPCDFIFAITLINEDEEPRALPGGGNNNKGSELITGLFNTSQTEHHTHEESCENPYGHDESTNGIRLAFVTLSAV